MKHFMVFLSKKTGFLFVMASKPSIHWMSIKHHHSHEKRKEPLSLEQCVCAPAAWKKKNLGEAISNLLVRPNECVSPQGSVEAQCGLVLNGQGGVIRRGKAPFIVCCCTRGREHSRLDTTRQAGAGRQNRRNTPLLSAVNTFERERPPFSRLLTRQHTAAYTRMRRRVPFTVWNGLSLNTYVFFYLPVTPNIFFEGFFFFFPREN